MAAIVTSAWAKPGAWALDSEEHEDELKQEPPANGRALSAEISDFPDLMTAAATKTKKKKPQTLSLGEFATFLTNKTTSYQAVKGLTGEDLMKLPTGPRQRTAEELDRSGLSGGFRSYGDRNNESRWGNAGDDEGRREALGPSRAGKKSTNGGGFDRREGSYSRADESDSWGSNKGRKGGGFDRERRMGFESSGDSDNWGKKKEAEGRRFGGNAFDSLRDRRVANDLDTWGKRREELNGGGGSMNRPKLNLQPRKLPVGDVEAVKPSKGSNPFGDARPREEVLKEKGEDWKEIDAMKVDLGFKRGVGRPRSDEDSTEKSWRKNQAADADVPSLSCEKCENGHTVEAEADEKKEQ